MAIVEGDTELWRIMHVYRKHADILKYKMLGSVGAACVLFL